MTTRPVRYKNCELKVTREGREYVLNMDFYNNSPENAIGITTKLDDNAMIEYFEQISLAMKSRADEVRALSQRYDSALGLVKKVRGAR